MQANLRRALQTLIEALYRQLHLLIYLPVSFHHKETKETGEAASLLRKSLKNPRTSLSYLRKISQHLPGFANKLIEGKC